MDIKAGLTQQSSLEAEKQHMHRATSILGSEAMSPACP